MRHSPSFCAFDGCTRQPLPYSRYCQFCQRKGAERDYQAQSLMHAEAIKARREVKVSPAGWEVLLGYCAPTQGPWGSTYTYAIGVHRYVKFGQSRSVDARLLQLQIASPHRLRLLASLRSSVEMERHIHAALKKQVYRGEWFKLDETTDALIRLMRANNVEKICRMISSLVEGTGPVVTRSNLYDQVLV